MAEKNYNLNYQVQIIQQKQDAAQTVRIIAPLASEQFMMDIAAQYSAPWSGGLLSDPKIATISSAAFGIVPIVQGMTAQVWAGATETELGIDLALQAQSDAEMEVRFVIKQLFKLVTPGVGFGGFLTSPGPKVDWAAVGQASASALQSIGVDTSAFQSMQGNQQTANPNPAPVQTSNGFVARGTTNPNAPGTQKEGKIIDQTQSSNDGGQAASPVANPSTDQNLGAGENPINKYVSEKISLRIGRHLFFDNVVITNVQVTEENQFDYRGYPMFARVSIRFKPMFIIVQSDLDRIFGATQQNSPNSGTNNSTAPQQNKAPEGQMPQGGDVQANPIDVPPPLTPTTLPPPGAPVAQSNPVSNPPSLTPRPL